MESHRYSTPYRDVHSADINHPIFLNHIETVKGYIHTHLHEPLGLSELAAGCGFSIYYFARRFKQVTGLSPKQYVLTKRLEWAYTLLAQGNVTVSDVAHQTGFTDQSHLVRYFKKQWGITPKELVTQSLATDKQTLVDAVTEHPNPFFAPTPTLFCSAAPTCASTF
jgi:AraC-like DNA-binding protein